MVRGRAPPTPIDCAVFEWPTATRGATYTLSSDFSTPNLNSQQPATRPRAPVDSIRLQARRTAAAPGWARPRLRWVWRLGALLLLQQQQHRRRKRTTHHTRRWSVGSQLTESRAQRARRAAPSQTSQGPPPPVVPMMAVDLLVGRPHSSGPCDAISSSALDVVVAAAAAVVPTQTSQAPPEYGRPTGGSTLI